MTYSRDLEDRIDRYLDRFDPVTKRMMFGGVCYLRRGNMCFGIYKESLVLRIDQEKAEDLISSGQAGAFDITGRAMKGWALIPPDVIETEEQLLEMLELGAEFALSLPAKKSPAVKRK
jgi:TfoX/Sxy family transcriptional regulator of competence genes